MIEEDMREVKDRSRRIETRLTKLMTHLGYDTMASTPEWKPGVVEVPSISTSIKDILAAVPDDWHARFWVTHKGTNLAQMIKEN